jgi:hypothetical protein
VRYVLWAFYVTAEGRCDETLTLAHGRYMYREDGEGEGDADEEGGEEDGEEAAE